MAIRDNAVVTAAKGYVFLGPVGNPAPSPAELDTLNPETFGAQVYSLVSTGAPTGGTFTLTIGTETTDPLPYNATAAGIQAAVEALEGVGVGNAYVSGGPILTDAVELGFIGALHGQTFTVTVDDTGLTGGTTPAVEATQTQATNGWTTVGHTSREDMPEFGFDGGDTEIRGTWQNEQLREVTTEAEVDYLTLHLHQLDKQSFELYYGENASNVPGVFGVAAGVRKRLERALLIIIVDGDVRVGFYAPKSSVRREDAIGLPVDGFATLPIRATFLKVGENNLFEWISQDTLT